MPEWTCVNCGKTFALDGPGSVVYCSDACMKAHLTPVAVSAADLAWALRYMTVDGAFTRDVKARLEAALSCARSMTDNVPIGPNRDSR